MFSAAVDAVRRGALLGAVLSLILPVAFAAAMTSYPDQAGSSFLFQNMVEETTTAGDPDPIWGAPTVVGDTLIFTPTGYASNATGGSADQTNATFSLDIVSQDKNTIGIKQLLVTELGDYSLTGAGTDATSASALAGAFLVIEEVNLNGVITPFVLAASATDFVEFDTPTQAGDWMLSIDANVQALVDGSFAPGTAFATSVSVVWNNDLASTSEGGTTAQIQKKIGLPSVTMQVIPEPGTAVLLALGLTGLAAQRSRRHR